MTNEAETYIAISDYLKGYPDEMVKKAGKVFEDLEIKHRNTHKEIEKAIAHLRNDMYKTRVTNALAILEDALDGVMI